jgi:hypothetical protein
MEFLEPPINIATKLLNLLIKCLAIILGTQITRIEKMNADIIHSKAL